MRRCRFRRSGVRRRRARALTLVLALVALVAGSLPAVAANLGSPKETSAAIGGPAPGGLA
jgi:hypothetical protein